MYGRWAAHAFSDTLAESGEREREELQIGTVSLELVQLDDKAPSEYCALDLRLLVSN